jgi:membrane fusion protein (multidrug efflux system)
VKAANYQLPITNLLVHMQKEDKQDSRTTGDLRREDWTDEEEGEPQSRRARAQTFFRRHRWLFALGVAIIVAAGAFVWRYYSVRQSTDDAQIDGHIVPVSARVGGTVMTIGVADNQYVDRGAVLVTLDPRDYQVALDRARADLASSEASAAAARTNVPITSTTTTSNVSTAEAALNAAHKEVDAAQARAAEARANADKLTADLKRARLLVAKEEISEQQFDAAVAASASANAAVQAAEANVAAARSYVAQAEAGLRSARTAPRQLQMIEARAAEAQAAVQRSRAMVQQAELNLQYTTVRAPFAGIVSKRGVELGQVVMAGQPLYALINLEDVYVTANFKETQLERMCPGQPAAIYVDTFGRDYQGRVDSLSGATGERFSLLPPENASGNYVKVVQRVPVKIAFDPGQDAAHELRPGMSVEPTVRLDKPCGK